MLYDKNVETFVSSNKEEIRKLAHSICIRHNVTAIDDIIQEFYFQLIHRNILKKFNPEHPSATKISTFLYSPIENIVRAYKNSENSFDRGRVDVSYYDRPLYCGEFEENPDGGPHERKKSMYNGNIVNIDFENMTCQNQVSDSIDGINLDLNLFEKYLEAKNRTYKLNRRKNKNIHTKGGLNLLYVFRLMRQGFTNREIAAKYGVSDMWVTILKHEIKSMLERFGIVWSHYQSAHHEIIKDNF